jgi:uncharacterized membrane protein YGL010W
VTWATAKPKTEIKMKSLTEQLTKYASYHRDKRNILTHFIGIPMIVVGIAVLLSRPSTQVGNMIVSPALIAIFLSSVYYLILDMRLGMGLTLFLAFSLMFGQSCALLPTSEWLSWGLGLFVIGWIFQFVGHYWEGQKPAFVDDIMGLIIGPLFVIAEAAFLLGLRKELQGDIEATVGPTLIRAVGKTASSPLKSSE